MRGVRGVEVTEEGVWSAALATLDTEANTPEEAKKQGTQSLPKSFPR